MKINLMRKLDYYAGIPICFLLSIVNFIFKAVIFKKAKNISSPKIAFIKLSELGSIVLGYSLFKRVKKDYPSGKLFFVTFAKNKDVFRLLDDIVSSDDVFVIRDDSLWAFICDTLKVITRLRKENIDILFDLEFFSRFSAILSYLSRAKQRIGFDRYTFEGLYKGNLFTHKIQYNPLNHMSRVYLSLAGVIKKQGKNSPELDEGICEEEIMIPKYISKAQAKKELGERLNNSGIEESRRVILLNAGEGMLPLREWPIENFITLGQRLIEDQNTRIILIGTDGANSKGEKLLRALNSPRCVNFIGQTSLEELMELFLRASILISNDCGLVHLAMLSPIKKFVIFGPESPKIFGPLGKNNHIFYSDWPCSPCLSVFNHRDSACKNNVCLKIINPEYVYGVIRKEL